MDKSNPQPSDHYLYFNESTGRWHDMIVVGVVKPGIEEDKKLFWSQDRRKTVVVMFYLEDVSNTRIYFYKSDLDGPLFKKADMNWKPIEE